MDFEEASRILNMELLGLTPETFDSPPGHVIDQARAAFRAIPNVPDEIIDDWDEDDEGHSMVWRCLPDPLNETTDTERDYQLIVNFDAQTELEARLAVDALVGFAKRRLNLAHPVFTARIDN